MSDTQERRLGQAAAALAAGDHLAAERMCGEILARVPREPRALHIAALARHGQGDHAGARELLRRSLESDPLNLEAMKQLGAAELEAGNHLQAESWLRRAIALGGGDASAMCWLGLALSFQDRHAEAVDFFRQAAAAQPEDPGLRLNLGNALMRSGAPEPAIASFEEALRLKPDYPKAHNSLGEALLQLGRVEEAADCFRRAIAGHPENAEFRCDLGNALAAQQLWEAAIGEYERAFALDPALYEAQYSLAVARLFRHEFERAWVAYESRLRSKGFRSAVRKNLDSVDLYERLPRWAGPGEAVAGEVAIWAEQGIGDQVLFSTLIPELIATGAPFVYEVDRRLLKAYERAFPGTRFVTQEEPPREVLQRASRVLLAGSLPRLFRSTREDFARQPAKLLGARQERVTHYRQRLAALEPGLKVALSWRSTRKVYWAPEKSAPLEQLAPLLGFTGAQFVDVQYGDTAAERGAVEQALGVRLARFEDVDHFNDLEELLAILEACNLVITTSNATAHFAGALGKRTWLMYLADRSPFHYWAHGGDRRCLWYPSVEIVSAPEFAGWSALARTVAGKLERELRAA